MARLGSASSSPSSTLSSSAGYASNLIDHVLNSQRDRSTVIEAVLHQLQSEMRASSDVGLELTFLCPRLAFTLKRDPVGSEGEICHKKRFIFFKLLVYSILSCAGQWRTFVR
jgi:hypothetical protein